jgi:four helix bundle protein
MLDKRGPGARGQGPAGRPPVPTISHFKELHVWQGGMDLVEAVYRSSASFPKAEQYGLTGQVRRAAVSVPSNIAEGHSRESTREFLKHVSIAMGSLSEVETQMEIANRLGYLSAEDLASILDRAAVLGRQLYALRNALARKL